MFLYKYSGIVKQFNLVVHSHWSGYTYAVSEAKARSNLTYQFKKEFGMAPNTKISLPGRVELQKQESEIIPDQNYQLTFDDILNG